jgi:putative ABC transport system permease protein
LWLLPAFITGAVVIGLIAGIYPAIYLSSFRPVEVLKGNRSRGAKNSALRSGLVVFQFTISIILIMSTVLIDRQMKYVLTKKLGYDKDQVMLLQGAHTLGENVIALKNELIRLPEVKSATISSFVPVDIPQAGTKRNGNAFFNEGGKGIDPPVGGQRWEVDHDYVKTMGLKLISGRNFSKDIQSDSQAVVINQTMAEALHLKDPIGKRITNGWGTWPVIGVVEDFHYESMKEYIQPLCLVIGRSSNIVSVKMSSSDMPAAIASVSKIWKQFSPNQSIRYSFLDQQYAHMHEDVKRMGLIFSCFAILAIIIACLGLFALSAFMVEQRNKEISIRLVLGASLKSIFNLLTFNFVKLVLIAFVIATPIAWYGMNVWLQDFSYKIDIAWDSFLIAGAASVMIALGTISYQSVKAALTNPVNGLRSE